jgi:hypothetical protein
VSAFVRIPDECPACGGPLDFSAATHDRPWTTCPRCGAVTRKTAQMLAWLRRHGRAAAAALALAAACAAPAPPPRVVAPDPCAGLEDDELLECVGAPAGRDAGGPAR